MPTWLGIEVTTKTLVKMALRSGKSIIYREYDPQDFPGRDVLLGQFGIAPESVSWVDPDSDDLSIYVNGNRIGIDPDSVAPPPSPTVELGPESLRCIGDIAEAIRHAVGPVHPPVSKPQVQSEVMPPATESSVKDQDIKRLFEELSDLKELVTAERGEVIKEFYTANEVAKKTGNEPYTIRQACNKGRIAGACKPQGNHWRIPHESVIDIQNNGLPPE